MTVLAAPFPYYGGKARRADVVWREFGHVTVYAEPFAGSLAVLLASEPHRREIVCDTDGHIANILAGAPTGPDRRRTTCGLPHVSPGPAGSPSVAAPLGEGERRASGRGARMVRLQGSRMVGVGHQQLDRRRLVSVRPGQTPIWRSEWEWERRPTTEGRPAGQTPVFPFKGRRHRRPSAATWRYPTPSPGYRAGPVDKAYRSSGPACRTRGRSAPPWTLPAEVAASRFSATEEAVRDRDRRAVECPEYSRAGAAAGPRGGAESLMGVWP